jgi:hypothetical protein
MAGVFLTAVELRSLLQELGRRLHDRGVEGRLLIVGGAAMSLRHDERRSTRDIDAQFEPVQEIQQVAVEIAGERGLRDNWLSAEAIAFLPAIDTDDRVVFCESPGLTVELASARVLLAMKMAAFRATDIPDLTVLFEELEIRDPDDAVRITRQLYGEHAVAIGDDDDEDLRLRAEDVLDRIARQQTRYTK